MAAGGSPGGREVLKVFMICKDLNRVLSSFYVDTSLLETLDHREKLFVVDRII